MDKRVLTRAVIPGARVRYKKIGTKGFFNLFSRPLDIHNLSKSGLSFQLDKKLPTGALVYMKLFFPDGHHLHLRGQVRWHRRIETAQDFSVGVQFFPFGTRGEYNPPKALDYLRAIDGQAMTHLKENYAE